MIGHDRTGQRTARQGKELRDSKVFCGQINGSDRMFVGMECGPKSEYLTPKMDQ